jgi:hypothetical protein
MTSSLEEIWQEIAPDPGASIFRRVDEKHPLDLYAGVDPVGARVLLLLTNVEPPDAPITPRGFEIEKGRRTDGRWALTVSLRMPELSTLFSHLCEDLVESLRTGCTPEESGRFVMERIGRWARLLARTPKRGLDELSYRGLLAELVVLQRLLIPTVGVSVAVRSWFGPLDADQDFRLSDRLIEVKSTVLGSLVVTVSSAEQLDVHGFPLSLVAVPIGDGVPRIDGTLESLIEHIRDDAREDPISLNIFEERIGMTGYDPKDNYSVRPFATGPIRYFEVTHKFPRLVRSLLLPAIVAVQYQLNLGACHDFEVDALLR